MHRPVAKRIALHFAALAVLTAAMVGVPVRAEEPTPIYLDEPAPAPEAVVVDSGTLKTEYDDGAPRLEREVLKLSDNEIVNHGRYIEYYPSGNKFADGAYKNGVHDGEWTYWYDNGQICKKIRYVDGRADGTWEVYREDGTLQAKRGYKNNLREGTWLTYHDDGETVRVEENFVDGLRNGVSRAYFANGRPQRELTFKDNKLDGPMVEWDAAGRKLGEGSFKDNKRHGKFIVYRTDGTTVEQTYEDGRLMVGAGN